MWDRRNSRAMLHATFATGKHDFLDGEAVGSDLAMSIFAMSGVFA